MNIQDNGDGTFTAFDGRAKKRILKEYHRQGIRIRSKKEEDGTWTIYPVGERLPRAARMPTGEARYPRGIYRAPYYRQRMPMRRAYLGPSPVLYPTARGRPRVTSAGPRRPSAFQRYGKEKYQREIESHPYTVDEKGSMKLKPGFIEYEDSEGIKHAVSREPPKGFFRRAFESREQRENRRLAIRQQSQRDWAEMERRSEGQPSTKISGEEIFRRNKPEKPVADLTPAPRATPLAPATPADTQKIRDERISTISTDEDL